MWEEEEQEKMRMKFDEVKNGYGRREETRTIR
jgi:hypothetical protein